MKILTGFCSPPKNQKVLLFNPSTSQEYNKAVVEWLQNEHDCEIYTTAAKTLDAVEGRELRSLDCAVDLFSACFRQNVENPKCVFTGKDTVPAQEGGVVGYYNVCPESMTFVLADRAFLNQGIYDEDYGDKLGKKINPKYGLLAGVIFQDIDLPPKGKLLEVGFSNTAILVGFGRRGWKVTGLDLACSKERKKQIKGVGGKFIYGDIGKDEIDGQYDIVWASHLIEHLDNPLAVIEKLCRAVSPGGYLFLSAPDAKLWFEGKKNQILGHMHPDQHIWLGCSDHVAQKCRDEGLTIIKEERYGDPLNGQFEYVTKNEWRILAQKK